MAEKMSWSMSASSLGASVNDTGAIEIDAATRASVTVTAGTPESLNLNLPEIAKLRFLAITSSLYDEKVAVSVASGAPAGAGAPAGPAPSTKTFKLMGPLVLCGDSIVQLLGPTLAFVTLTNSDPNKAASIEILVGHQL
jgi:hypothetical protein